MRFIKRMTAVVCVLVLFAGLFQAGGISAAKKENTLVLNQKICVMKKGTTYKLKATASLNELEGAVRWSSNNWNVASVSQKGVIRARKKGKATIRVTAGRLKASCKVIVGTPIKKIKTSKKVISLTPGAKTKLKTEVVPRKASIRTLKFSSKNKKIATVNKKGLIRGVAAGTTKVTVHSTDGSNRRSVIKVKVRSDKSKSTQPPVQVDVKPIVNVVCPTPAPAETNPVINVVYPTSAPNDIKVTGITLSDTEKELAINKKAQLSASVMPENAADRSVVWKSSDENVASVSHKGLVIPEGEGTAEISASTTDGKYSASCMVTVSPEAVVSTDREIAYALSKKNLKTLEISSDTTRKLTVPEGNFDDVEMIVNLPNGELENHATFKSIRIENIAEDTYFENAIGNLIKVFSKKSHIVIGEKANATIVVTKKNESTAIENHGIVKKLELSTSGTVDITGTSKEQISVQIKAEVTISTTRKLDIGASSHFDINVRPGAESTKISVDAEIHMPGISGLGVISVRISATGELKTVVSENKGPDKLANDVRFTGFVRDIDGNAIEGAEIFIVPYKKDYDMKDIWSESSAEKMTTNAEGEYGTTTKIKAGNYYFAARKDGYKEVPQQIVPITSTYGEVYTNEEIIMVPAEWTGQKGNVTGRILDSAEKDLVLPDVAVRIRKGKGSMQYTIPVVKETRTDEKGMYLFTDLDAGYYTIELDDDKTISADGKPYVRTWINVLVRPGETVTEGAVMSKTLTDQQIRFVLSWGAKDSGAAADLDAHLRGPGGYTDSSYRFHTYYHNKNYNYSGGGVKSHADLDVDDIDYEGPETTTIYESAPGIYSYYVHNYTDRSSRKSTRLSESSVKVEVYYGNQKSTYYIPKKEGTVWHVFDYDSNADVLKTVNTMYYESDPSYVGNTVDWYKQEISSYLQSCENYQETLEQGTGDDIEKKRADYQKQMDALTEKQEAEAASLYYEVRQYWHNLYDDCYLYCSAKSVYDYDRSGDKLSLWVEQKDFEPAVDTLYGQNGARVEEVTSTDPDAWKTFRVTAKNGHARVTRVYLKFNPERIAIQSVKAGERSLGWQRGRDYKDDTQQYPCIYVYSGQGTEFDLSEVKVTFSPASAEITYNSQQVEGEYTVTAETETKTKTWVVRKLPDAQIKDPANRIYKTEQSGSTLTLYAEDREFSEGSECIVNGKAYKMTKSITASEKEPEPDYSYYQAYSKEEGITYYIHCYAIGDACTLNSVSFNQNVTASIDQRDCSVTVTAGASGVTAESLSLRQGACGNGKAKAKYEPVQGEDYTGEITVTLDGVEDYSKVYKVYFKPYQAF